MNHFHKSFEIMMMPQCNVNRLTVMPPAGHWRAAKMISPPYRLVTVDAKLGNSPWTMTLTCFDCTSAPTKPQVYKPLSALLSRLKVTETSLFVWLPVNWKFKGPPRVPVPSIQERELAASHGSLQKTFPIPTKLKRHLTVSSSPSLRM